jgi:hypothetical protein
MIPEFQENGYLPPGIHIADVEELERRFGQQSEMRQIQMESVHWLLALARQAGVLRVVINGSFVTDVLEPNDVDCVLLIDENFPRNEQSEVELRSGLPFLEVQLVTADAFELLVDSIFATDRRMRPKGMVEVLL